MATLSIRVVAMVTVVTILVIVVAIFRFAVITTSYHGNYP